MRYFWLMARPPHGVAALEAPTLESSINEQKKDNAENLPNRICEHVLIRGFSQNPNDFVALRFEHEVPDDKAGPFVVYASGNMNLEPVWCRTIQEALMERDKMVERAQHGNPVDVNVAWARERLAREKRWA